MGTRRDFLLASAASAAIRIPAFVYPIAALRLLGFEHYVIFAAHYVFAGAIAAFLGEAVAATVSRTAPRAGPPAEAVSRVGPVALGVVLCGACAILATAALYLGVSSLFDEAATERPVAIHHVALLSTAFFLNPPLLALANVRGRQVFAAAWAIVSAATLTTVPLIAGRYHGLDALFATYGVVTLAMAAVLFVRVIDLGAARRAGSHASQLRGFLSSLGPIALAMALGGPIHGLCLFLLAHSEGGLPEMAVFSAYYPWSILIAFFAGVQSNFVISRLSAAQASADTERVRRTVSIVLYGNLAIALALACALYLGRVPVFAIYGAELPVREGLFALVLGCGVAAAAFASSSQIVMSFGYGRYVSISSILYAIAYCTTTAVTVVWAGYGAEGLAASLLVCLSFFVTLYVLAILRHALRRPVQVAAR